MSTGIIITLIVCGTVILLAAISEIGSILKINKTIKDLKKLEKENK